MRPTSRCVCEDISRANLLGGKPRPESGQACVGEKGESQIAQLSLTSACRDLSCSASAGFPQNDGLKLRVKMSSSCI